jgi:DNA-binding LacI/PurR family transcriptional regulator/signal transduction histidine kinase
MFRVLIWMGLEADSTHLHAIYRDKSIGRRTHGKSKVAREEGFGVRAGRSQKIIGIFTAQLDDAYQLAVWRGIEGRLRERGVGAVCFLGRQIDSPVSTETTANVAFRLADGQNLDGLIIVTTAIATFLDTDRIQQLFASRRGIPQVSVGLAVRGIPSVTVEGADGVKEVVHHLVREHGYRRFAFIGGPAGHSEAEERSRAFRRALVEDGVDFDEELAFKGNFRWESGVQAARVLLGTGRTVDSLVCANDRMALGAISVLREAGIRVPGDVAVVGFDGIEEVKYLTPPLTTVEQPLEGLGAMAVDSLLSLMGGARPGNRVLSCKPVFRQSCGCPPGKGYDSELTEIPPRAGPEERAAISELMELASGGDADGFILRFNAALADTSLKRGSPGDWNDYLSVIGNRVGPQRMPAALMEFARALVGESKSRIQAARRVAAEQRYATLRAVSASLAAAFEVPAMLQRLDGGLSALGIDSCYLVLFDDEYSATGGGRLVMAREDGKPRALPAGGIPFKAARLLPPNLKTAWDRRQWVLEPLIFQNEPLGYLLLPGAVDELAVYDTLREELGNALKGSLLFDQVRSHERRLEAEVVRRTAELTRMNDELTREVERRRRLEQEVIEISNRTMQKIGQDLHDDLCQHLAGIAMLAKVVRGVVALSGPAAVGSIDKISDLLADSISRAKQIARGLYPAGLEEHGLAAAVEELVESARRNYPVMIEFRASPDFSLPDTDLALQVYRIVQEALANALKHAGSDRIEVYLTRDEPRRRADMERAPALVAEVTDHGAGLPHETTGGMGLRIMRYRAETAGVELRIERLDPGTRISCRIPGARGAF